MCRAGTTDSCLGGSFVEDLSEGPVDAFMLQLFARRTASVSNVIVFILLQHDHILSTTHAQADREICKIIFVLLEYVSTFPHIHNHSFSLVMVERKSQKMAHQN